METIEKNRYPYLSIKERRRIYSENTSNKNIEYLAKLAKEINLMASKNKEAK